LKGVFESLFEPYPVTRISKTRSSTARSSGSTNAAPAQKGNATGMQRAAVLVGLAAYPGEVRVILTRRTMALRVHAGQIAFLGGKIEARDKSSAAAVAFKINPDAAFEALEMPFAFPMNAANPRLRHEEFDGKPRHFHAMPYGRGTFGA
jgi:hypothetical protein